MIGPFRHRPGIQSTCPRHLTVIDHLVELRRRFTVSLVAMALGYGGAGRRDDSPFGCTSTEPVGRPETLGASLGYES